MSLLGSQTLLPAEEPGAKETSDRKQKAERTYGRLVCTDTTQSRCRCVAPDRTAAPAPAREHGNCVGAHCFLAAIVALRGSGTVHS